MIKKIGYIICLIVLAILYILPMIFFSFFRFIQKGYVRAFYTEFKQRRIRNSYYRFLFSFTTPMKYLMQKIRKPFYSMAALLLFFAQILPAQQAYNPLLPQPVAVSKGGTASNLSATGGTSQVLKQTSVGGNITVAQLAATDLSNGVAGTGSVTLTDYRSSFQPIYSGYWRTGPFTGATSTGPLIGGFMFFMPYIIERSHNVTDITFEVTTAATASLSVALYADSAGAPNQLIEASGNLATSGTVTIGNKTYTFTGGSGGGAGAQVLNAGTMKVVWMGVWCSSSSVAGRTLLIGQQFTPFYLSGTGVSAGGFVYYKSVAYTGSWPSRITGTTLGNGAYLLSLKVQ